ncbi:PREDICTED: uncharacterized protein LOC104601518 [Nelumbo nucifera]|uniref:Uncharacterized protein LOC104601518 n=1 Tax=Nelumbo nucifera TaxID=4432 RepID=A0A1U8A7A6_NELNU|nr:PREDICTED: uncharacterized protein LOC104601518 [Nelumbo nucifera]
MDKEMVSVTGLGFMAAFAVSGSVVLIVFQLHKRLLSEFMKKAELELRAKKRVRFAEDVVEPSSNNKEYRRQHSRNPAKTNHFPARHGILKWNPVGELENMPLNRLALYRGILEYRMLKGYSLPYF